MKKIILLLFLIFLTIAIVISLRYFPQQNQDLVSPLIKSSVDEKPLERYCFEALRQREGQISNIELGEIVYENDDFVSQVFFFKSEGRRVSGLINLPKGKGPFPVIVMLRGWVDPEIYQTGVGTSRAGEVLAENGFITLAPDFLGYGQSDDPPDDVWEERFLKPVAVFDLLVSIKSINQANADKVGIWAHSNGGMIALSVLEITGQVYPTTLWAPVSKPFPYDILYYTDEYDDYGQLLRAKLAQFEADYDVFKYSWTSYLDWLNKDLKIQVHQGGLDDAVPIRWTNDLNDLIRSLDIDIVYYTYPQADHNMRDSWQTVIQRDINFFKQTLTN